MGKRLRIDQIHPLQDGQPAKQATSVLIANGQIVAMGAQAINATADQVIDGAGQWLLPGLIDLNCHLGEPGPDRRGTIATETLAAAKGGFTQVCAVPETSPVNDSGAVTHLILDLAAQQGQVRVLPVGALTRGLAGEMLSDMVGLMGAGCIALGNGGRALRDARVLRRCMAYAHTFGFTLFIQPENAVLAADGCAHDGALAARMGLPGIPAVAETTAVSEMLLLAEETGVRLHLGQLSCARSVQLVRAAKARGLAVTADVAMHHLVYTDQVITGFDGRFHVRPPIREESDRKALLAGVEEGTIDAICSQHRPQDQAAKQAPFAATEAGLSGLETTLSLGLRLVAQGQLSQGALLRALIPGPAAVLGQPLPQLAVGLPADAVLLRPDGQWTVSPQTLLSTGKQAPAMGETLPGVVSLTMVAGQIVYQQAD
ncbi:MAG: dihydroorotase [Halomonadaceae bacterium]|nr:MAG: dihydroorotase [Halomonadaceae bacterium]